MKFIDEAIIEVEAGDGGDGSVAWRREKYVPRGGAHGGDGGHGGNVVVQGKTGISTLMDIHYRKTFKAERGEHGMGKEKNGKHGEDLVIAVPLGTLVKEATSGKLLADVTTAGVPIIIAKAGRGGHGNAHFVSSTRQAPDFAQPGEKGEVKKLKLELKLLADVGLVGFPNAGKSTLISAISNARPKIADYPFTTKVPHLGVVRVDADHNFVVADIPGLIEGASHGAGMGTQFLRHVERTRVLLHLLDVTDPAQPDPWKAYQTVRSELATYSPQLLKKPQIVVLTKMDLPEAQEISKEVIKKLKKAGQVVIAISAASHEGLQELIRLTAHYLFARAG